MIEISHVDKWYGPNFQALKDCTTRVEKGEVVVVCGPSGSGKSTLIKCVNGLEPIQAGSIVVDGVKVNDRKTNLPKLRARIGMVFQNFELFPHLKVTDNLCLAQQKALGRSRDEAMARAMKLLERVGLKEHAGKFPGQLSGGQQQRVAIARAIASSRLRPSAFCCARQRLSVTFRCGNSSKFWNTMPMRARSFGRSVFRSLILIPSTVIDPF